MVLQTERLLAGEAAARLGATAKELQAAVEEAKDALDRHDDAQVSAAYERLTKASHKAAEAMYGRPSATPTDASAANDDGKDDGVIDAEFEEKAS
jgi:molecular chaperone DnaK